MAEVKLSLAEYNEIHTRLKLLDELLDSATFTDLTEEEMERIKTHGGSLSLYGDINVSLPGIRNAMLAKLRAKYGEGLEISNSDNRLANWYAGSITFPTPEDCINCGITRTDETAVYKYCGRAYCRSCCSKCDQFADCRYIKREAEKAAAQA